MANNTLTKTELEIMQYFWTINGEVTAGDIKAHFAHKNWSKQAVSSFLKKLAKTGYLNVRKASISKYYYSAAITEEEYNIFPAKAIINTFFSGSLRNFVCAFVKPTKLTAEQIQQLDNLISQLEKENSE